MGRHFGLESWLMWSLLVGRGSLGKGHLGKGHLGKWRLLAGVGGLSEAWGPLRESWLAKSFGGKPGAPICGCWPPIRWWGLPVAGWRRPKTTWLLEAKN